MVGNVRRGVVWRVLRRADGERELDINVVYL